MTQYIFTSSNKVNETITFLTGLPNFQDAGISSGRTIIANFNHTTQQEIDDFCSDVLAQNGITTVKIDGIETNLIQKYKYLLADVLIYVTELSITKTNVGTTFTNLYNDYAGRNFFVDLVGYNKLRYFINWNSNGGTGTHNLRIVNNGDDTQVLMDIVVTNGQNVGNITIPDPLFKDFRGRLRIQVKSTVNSDDPICDRIMLHAIRPNKT